MILSKDSNNNWTPTAGGTGTFIGTLAAFNAIKDTLPVNTVAYITDDGNGDLQPIDAVTDGNMHPVTSNAVYDTLNTIETNVVSVSNLISGVTAVVLESCKIGKLVDLNLRLSIAANTLQQNYDNIVGKINLRPKNNYERFYFNIDLSPYADVWVTGDGNIHCWFNKVDVLLEPYLSRSYITRD